MDDTQMQSFNFGHLPPDLQEISARFHDLAWTIANTADAYGPEVDVCLRKLLEAKDAAVRACGVLKKGRIG